jgi:hypothetical protein
MGAAVYVAGALVPTPPSWAGALTRLGIAVIIGGCGYVIIAAALRQHELRWLLARAQRPDSAAS